MDWVLAQGLSTDDCRACGRRPDDGEPIALLTHLRIPRCMACYRAQPDAATLERLHEQRARQQARLAAAQAAPPAWFGAPTPARRPAATRRPKPFHSLPARDRRRHNRMSGND